MRLAVLTAAPARLPKNRRLSAFRAAFARAPAALLMVLLAAMVLFPVLWMALSSLKTDAEIFSPSPTFLPLAPTFEHYLSLFTHFRFGRYLPNSLIIAACTTAFSVVFGVLAAYGFSRFRFPGSSALLFLVLLVRLFTPAAFVVPLYDLMGWLGLLDTLLGIIIGNTIINLPFVVWTMAVFFDDFPAELEEAAELDGMSTLSVMLRVVIPLAAPSIATVSLFSFNAGWQDFLFGLSFSRTAASIPATVGISAMDTGYKVYWGAMMAGGTLMSLPIIIIAFALQKYFVKGLLTGSSK